MTEGPIPDSLHAPPRVGQNGHLDPALGAWRRALGKSEVVTDAAALRAAETATFRTSQTILAILRPGNRAEVQACMRIANRFGIPVHPVSCGKNWGYGSRVPVRDGCVLMDLARMDRIVAFEERLAYVTLEPGVTFRKLHRFLRERGSRLHASPTGSTPDASPLANALERGLGFGPLGDRFSGACAMEVVLPTGDCLHTGFARFANAATAPLHRWGVGPHADGLFSQSNLGVVTQMTLWLTPIPAHSDALTATIASGSGLPRLIDALQPLFLRGVLRNPVKITNDFRRLSVATRYPWSLMGTKEPLPQKMVRMLLGKPVAWTLSGLVEYATPRHRAPQRRLLRDALGAAGAAVTFRRDTAIEARHPGAWEEVFRPVSGFDVAATYWRKRTPPPRDMDPDRDRCGAIWCSPVVPLRGRDVALAVRVIRRVTAEAGLEPMIAITVLDGRTAHVVAPVLFDRSVPGEDERALGCAERMIADLERRGYYPYRLGVNSMRALPESRGDYAAFRQALTRALDPNRILSPGRYEE